MTAKPPRSDGAPGPGSEPAAANLDRLPIGPGDTLAAAGRKAMSVHLDRLLAREALAADPERPDDLRRYRVATRRLRAAMRMFADAYPAREVKPLRRRLGDLSDAVATVRDLDHRIADLDRWATEQASGTVDALAPLRITWVVERAARLAQLVDRLASRRHRRLISDLTAFVDAPSAPAGGSVEAGPHLIGDRVASQLWSAYEEVRAFGRVMRWADVETLHQLRIHVKRLRDDLEFLADLLGPDTAQLTERLVALQDHLGALNDAVIAEAAVRDFLEHASGALTTDEQAAIAAYLADRENEIAERVLSVWRPWHPVSDIAFARRLGRLVVVAAPAP